LLKANIAVVAEDVLIISEEFAEWDDSKRRIDLLGVDQDAKLVVIELKRDDEGGHMELQAIRYAAMVSSMTFDRAAEVFQSFLDSQERGQNARGKLLEFLGWNERVRRDLGAMYG
jgi:RecB family endonuclease NucS